MIIGLLILAGTSAVGQNVREEDFKLFPSDGVFRDHFGSSVAIDGDHLLIGATGDDDQGDGSGSVYYYRWQDDEWNWLQKLAPPELKRDEHFGNSATIDGDKAFAANIVGTVYGFMRDDDLWRQVARIDGASGCFGCDMALVDGIAFVGAPGDHSAGRFAGAVFVYQWNGEQWQPSQQLFASDAKPGDSFGADVAATDDLLVVGSAADQERGGAAYVFRRRGEQWVEVAKLLPSDGVEGDDFGLTVAISGGAIIVGAYSRDEVGETSGAAYVFRWNGAEWHEEQKLVPSDAAALARFGGEMRLEGGRAVIASTRIDNEQGAAYVFEWKGSRWEETFKLIASDGEAADLLASSLDQSQNRIVLGAANDDHRNEDSGSAYAYHFDPNSREFILNVFGDCPGPGSVQAVGATPGGVVALVYALAMGSVEIPPGRPCAGTALGLDPSARLAGAMRADEDGAIVRDTPLPAAACGRVFVQAVDIATCAVSNVVAVE